LRSFPAGFCYFNQDGTFVASINKNRELVKYDENMKILWKIQGHFHHQINKSNSNEYLVMSSEFKTYKGKNVRFDELIRINESGVITKKFKFSKYMDQLFKKKIFSQFYLLK
jgi:hypothetical protein